MVQRIGASYVAKRIADQLLAAPVRPTEPVAEETVEASAAPALDGQVIKDEDGAPIGRAYRVPGVAVYVIADGRSDLEGNLERCLADPEMRLFVHRDGDRITGLIYAPDPNRLPASVEGFRADDV